MYCIDSGCAKKKDEFDRIKMASASPKPEDDLIRINYTEKTTNA